MAVTPTCYEVIREVDAAIRPHLAMDGAYFVLGGIATSALKHPDTEFDHTSQLIFAPVSAAESTMRDNGTKRDIDVLINTVLDDESATEIKADLQDATSGELEISVFGFDRHEPDLTAAERMKKTFGSWISRRTTDNKGVLRYELFPLAVEVDPASYEPWNLVLPNGSTVNVLNPAGHALAYSMRSISGVRYKDHEKVDQMTERIFADEEFAHQVRDGIFRPWLNFAGAIEVTLAGDLTHQARVFRSGTTCTEVAAFRAKGKLLGKLESQEALIKFAQHPIGEKILGGFVGTK